MYSFALSASPRNSAISAAALSAVTKLFGMHGVFWRVCGHGVAGIDGFYTRSSFQLYHELALINPDHPNELCEQLAKETGIPVVLMDANDLQRDQLGKSQNFPLTDAQIPAGPPPMTATSYSAITGTDFT